MRSAFRCISVTMVTKTSELGIESVKRRISGADETLLRQSSGMSPVLWDYLAGRAFAALRPDGERSARRTLRLAPSYPARAPSQSLCEHWLVVGLLGVVFCLAVVALFR